MKVGSAVLGVHVAVLCVFALTQGCVTTESQGSGRGAGARHKGPWKHDHKGKSGSEMAAIYQPATPDYGQDDNMGSIYDPVITATEDTTYMPPEPAVDTSSETYMVQKGDILGQIAVDFDTTVATLVALNHLSNPDVLYVGQELRVPAGRTGGKKMVKKSASTIEKGGTYVIQKGDTLSGIAVAAGVGIDDLRSLNNIKKDQIFAGEKLSIPSYGKVPSSARKSPPRKAPAPVVEPAAPAPLEPVIAPMAAPIEPAVMPVEANSMAVDMVQDHMVYPGETLDDIARQHGASKSEIMRMNNISDETAILEGQRLRIPIAE